jgi:hypothetical protein
MERQKYNKLILETLSKLVEKHPDLRFGQILVNCGIIELQMMGDRLMAIDPFNEESEVTWKRMLLNKFAFKEQYS